MMVPHTQMATYTWVRRIFPLDISISNSMLRTRLEQDPERHHQQIPRAPGQKDRVCPRQEVLIVSAFLPSLCVRSYRPGWDCHGLPIENKTLKELGVSFPVCTVLRPRCEFIVWIAGASRSITQHNTDRRKECSRARNTDTV